MTPTQATAAKQPTPASQHLNPKSDIEISQSATKRLILDVARDKLGIGPEHLEPYGHYKAKVSMDFIKSLKSRPNGKLILVSAITPTPAGEGKTTTTVGLTDALNHIGKKAMLCLREPSLGPSFGMKGGAAGGGYAQVVPMEDINLHFTGDFHAITSANNLLAAMIDNHIYWGNALGIDQRRVAWRRVLDMNDRALRSIVHVQYAPPRDAAAVDAKRIAPIDVIVDQGREQIISGTDRMQVAGEVEIDVLHRHHLGIAATGRAALHAE